MGYDSDLAAKTVSAREAADSLDDKSNLVLGMGVAMPPAFMAALAERARERRGLSRLNLYYMHGSKAATETILKPELMDVLKLNVLFMSGHDRAFAEEGLKRGAVWVHFVPSMFHQVGRLLTEQIRPDTFVTTVSPMDRSGHFSLGTNPDYAAELVRKAGRVIVEVNRNMPRTFGENLLHISQVDAVIEHDAPLMELPSHAPGPEDLVIGKAIAALIPDEATLQMGVGGVPEAVLAELRGHKRLGLHSELLSPPMIDLMRRGVLTGEAKTILRYKHVFTLALGNADMYDFMDDNPSIVGYPATWVNNPAVIRKNRDMISVNAALQVDLTGQVNSEALNGHQFSGTGGQLDFVRGAYLAPNGKSFIALHATAKGGTVSRIVPQLANTTITDPRVDTQFVVTEYGMADMKGRSLSERAQALIGIAHPDFRDSLAAEAKAIGLM
ncbi:acetyl-CoA hydrolase/transferase C-terminal domain-containing protein [Thalassobaculum sp. OXR-137]|uniref:acetyl-CoA hydrolase/transferase family protein n=1 Tax=Thalassobaculum sp. OXR-137 TaxID=3100173 RepID=UPI002AC967E9|nr:acetyl-CoA hydrolase/transferase C-terminal domain-containing protein [Thalassobaculum sp. OXR-137]WPZ36078.1 acetyl-CoA hydrolase/transferase C-terminal domain-containing protein [Thalassobaculum sp. OXR-137]